MAIARLSIKVGRRGKAAPHAAYIARIGQYARYLERGEKLEATEAGNMPSWAQFNPLEFWQAADSYERENGTTYREMEIALPRELNGEQQVALVREWVRQEIGGRHAYQWGIHAKFGSDGGGQPHVHLMFSERQHDNIARDPEQYFKRYNSKVPERGGARKGYGASAGRTLAKEQRINELKALRERWAEMCNAHLGKAGLVQRIDMRSYADQGVDIAPERKQLPSEWRGRGKADVIEFRQVKADLVMARERLAEAVPSLDQELRYQEAVEGRRIVYQRLLERVQRQDAGKNAGQPGQRTPMENQRFAAMSSRELTQEIDRIRPESPDNFIERVEEVIEARKAEASITKRRQAAERQARLAREQIAHWRATHPLRASMHELGVWRNKDVQAWAAKAEKAEVRTLALIHEGEDAALVTRTAREDARMRVAIAQAPAMSKIRKLEDLRQTALARERRAELQALGHRRRESEATCDGDLGAVDFS